MVSYEDAIKQLGTKYGKKAADDYLNASPRVRSKFYCGS